MEKVKAIAAVIAISLASTAVSGYQFATSDQEIFIPYILKLQDPQLFPNDLLFSQFTANASFFYQIMAYLAQFIDMEALFLAGLLFTKALLFIGIYLLAKVIFKKREIALLSLLPFLIPKFIGGAPILTYDDFFGYRSIGVIFLVFYLLFLLKAQFIKSSFLAAITLFFHPLSIIPSLLLSPVLILKNSKNKIKDIVIFVSIILSASILYLITFDADSNLLQKSQEWLSVIRFRAPYIFPSLWGILGWLSLGMYLTLIAIYLKSARNSQKANIILITVTSLFVFAVNFILLELFQLPGFVKFQLVRSIAPLGYLGLILAPCLLLAKTKLLKFFGLISFMALSLNLFYIFLASAVIFIILLIKFKIITKNTVPVIFSNVIYVTIVFGLILNILHLRNSINYQLQKNDWTDIQIWAKENTPEDTLFLVPPYQTGFRIFSHRPIVGDIKDGAVVIYSLSYAKSWSAKMNDLESYDNSDQSDFVQLANKYHFDYFVTRATQNVKFEKAYENKSFIIYKL